MSFQHDWVPLIRQALRRFFAGRGANNDITSLTGITGPITAASRLVLSEQATLETPPANAIGLGAIDVDGISSLVFKSPTGFESRLMRDRFFVARNNTGTTITKGTVVVVTGISGSGSSASLLVSRAQSNGTAMMPAAGIAAQDILNNGTGRCVTQGKLTDLNTSAFTALDALFVSPTVAGGLTNVRPTTPNRAQPVAQVVNSSATVGAILVNTQPVLNESLSTVQNSFTIGDATAGVKSLKFAGTTTRSLFDGASVPTGMAVGDTWTERNATTQAIVGEWEWNGTYWISRRALITTNSSRSHTATQPEAVVLSALPSLPSGSMILIRGFGASGRVEAATTNADYWDFTVSQRIGSSNITAIAGISTLSMSKTLAQFDNFRVQSAELAIALTMGNGQNTRGFNLGITKVAAAPNLTNVDFWISYSLIR